MTWIQVDKDELICLETGTRLYLTMCCSTLTLLVHPSNNTNNGKRIVARGYRAMTLFNRLLINLVREYFDNEFEEI